MSQPIDSFEGENHYLSNFHLCKVWWNGLDFASTEHAYQAAKSDSSADRAKVQAATSPGAAKRIGRTLPLRTDWGTYKFQVMKELLEQKFTLYPGLRQKLLSTKDRELIEGNNWHDVIWGRCNCDKHNGSGENHLGRQLMEVRDELRKKS